MSEEKARQGQAHNGLGGTDRAQQQRVDQGIGEIKAIISDLTLGMPVSDNKNAGEGNEQSLTDLKRALPSEIARVSTKIAQLEKELAQLEECKVDVAQNLF